MKKYGLLVVFMLLASVAFAAGNKNDLAYYGYDELETTAAVGLTDEIVVFESDIPKQGGTVQDIVTLADLASRPDVEFVSGLTDTIVAADDGKTIVYTAAQNKTVTMCAVSLLPKGITLINGNGDGALIIDPVIGDTYKTGSLGLDAGDKISSTGSTGASASINGSGTTGYVTTTGTWLDGGS